MHLVQVLQERKQRILLFDNLSPQIHGDVPDLSWRSLLRSAGVEVFRGDVRRAADWEKVLIDVDVKCVVHLAAETGTAQSMYEISRYTDTNVGGTAALLNYLANHKQRGCAADVRVRVAGDFVHGLSSAGLDRKSTRLNSSHT